MRNVRYVYSLILLPGTIWPLSTFLIDFVVILKLFLTLIKTNVNLKIVIELDQQMRFVSEKQ